MVWLYLECSMDYHCSQELEASTSHLENGSDQSPIVKSIPFVKQCSSLELQMETWDSLLYGMTSTPWSQVFLTDSSISCLEDSLARTSVLLEMEKGWMESEVDFFSRSFAWPKKSSPSSYSLKMSLQSHPEEEYKSLEKLPRWGMIVDGVLYPLLPLEQSTKEKDGFYWPTPKASDADRGDCPSERKRDNPYLSTILNITNGTKNLKINLKWLEWLMGYKEGWTELEPLETLSCPFKLEKLFKSCRELKGLRTNPETQSFMRA